MLYKKKLSSILYSSLFKRLALGVGANAYAQLVTLFAMVASVPVLISQWGVEIYGVWVALSALPAYLASSNLGIANAAASEMTILTARGVDGRNTELLEVYHTACATTLLMTALAFVFSLILILSWNSSDFIFTDILDVFTLKTTLSLLVLYTLITLYGGLWDAVFRSTGKYATGTFYLHSIRLIEQVLLLLSVVLFKADILFATILLVIVRGVGTLLLALHLAISMPTVPFGVEYSNMVTFKRLLPGSIGFMSMPIGYALFIQGMVLVAASFSASYAAIFSTTRTLTSLGRQIVSMISHASWPELSRAFGMKDYTLAKKLFIGSVSLTSLLLIFYFIFIGLFGHQIFQIWTNDQIDFNSSLFILLAVSAIAGSLWNQCYTLLASINKHIKFAVIFVCTGVVLISSCYQLQEHGYDILHTVVVLPVAEFILLILSMYFVRNIFVSRNANG